MNNTLNTTASISLSFQHTDDDKRKRLSSHHRHLILLIMSCLASSFLAASATSLSFARNVTGSSSAVATTTTSTTTVSDRLFVYTFSGFPSNSFNPRERIKWAIDDEDFAISFALFLTKLTRNAPLSLFIFFLLLQTTEHILEILLHGRSRAQKRDRVGQKRSRFEPEIPRGETLRPRKMSRGEHHRPTVREQVPRRARGWNREGFHFVRVERRGNLV